jgi:hydrogenase maturation protease
MSLKPLIIGIGNRYRGDDALGRAVALELRAVVGEWAEVIEHDGEPASLLESWEGRSRVILIDAVRSGSPSGAIHHIDLRAGALPPEFGACSTHAFGVAEAVELGRALGKLPPEIDFFGVEAESFDAGATLTIAVGKGLKELCETILELLRKEREHA